MAKNSSIEWTDHTFNPWWGCVKISPGCAHCYAEKWARRVGSSVWGESAERRVFSDAHWRQPILWNGEAQNENKRRRVFCASMADVFEDRRELDKQRTRLWNVIESTPHLDWQLLTKRPENVRALNPWGHHWPTNVWLGTTVENQTFARKRVPVLLSIPAHIRFLSCEPLLGEVNLSRWLDDRDHRLHWVIVGGESGSNARAMQPEWARQLRDQCVENNVPFHFKQWGHWAPVRTQKRINTISKEGGTLAAVGKKRGGRRLDGKTWNGLPRVDV
jgi:protein gp37